MLRHIIVPEDLTAHEIEAVFAISRDLETRFDEGLREPLFPGRVLGMVFEPRVIHFGDLGMFG